MGSTAKPTVRTYAYYGLSVALAVVVGLVANLSQNQVVSVGIFAAIIFGALFFWAYRLAFAFMGLAAMLLTGTIDVKRIVEFAGLDIILFLVGMMILIGFLEERRFFEHIVDAVVAKVGGTGRRLVVALMIMAAISAGLVDEVTSILFMAATVFSITTRLSLKPLPLLMMVIFATNVGSAATVVGNPVGVMIALRGGLTFTDFLRYATPVAAACLVVTIFICLFVFRKYIRELDAALKAAPGAPVDEHTQTHHAFWGPAALFGGVILTLVLHTQIENWLGLAKNSMLLGGALAGASIALLATGVHARELVERRVDWWTLSFFLALFASVGALQLTGVTTEVANGVAGISDSDSIRFLAFTGFAAVLSALMDNVLAVAMFIPVVSDLGLAGVDNFPFWWGLLFAGTLFGNLTMIGSTANIVAVGMLERRKLDQVTFLGWLKYGVLVAVPTMALAMVMVYLRFYV